MNNPDLRDLLKSAFSDDADSVIDKILDALCDVAGDEDFEITKRLIAELQKTLEDEQDETK